MMIFQVIILFAGLLLLVKGADWLVEGASALARRFHIPDLAIGLTIVAFGTSAPELIVNSFASNQNHGDIVFGNIIGSNNFNLFMILGITGLIHPLTVQSSTVWKEIPLSLFGVLVLFLLVNDFQSSERPLLTRPDGIILLLLFLAFLLYVYKQLEKNQPTPDATTHLLSTFKIWLYLCTGLAALFFGGRLVVNHAIKIAYALKISEKIVGLTIIAAGTSLPELATSVMATYRKKNDLAVGNVIGSNIFNIFFILGISALVHPIAYNKSFNTDLYLLSAGTAFLFLAMFTSRKKTLDRWEAAVLLAVFIGYTIYLILKEM